MRRILFLTGIIILVFSCCAFGDASLYRGSGNVGSVQTVTTASGYFVSVEDVGRLLGFTSSRSDEELLLTRGNSQLRVIANSAAAWRGMSIVPLYSAPFERNGKLWIDSQSAVSLFQSFAGSGQSNRLQFISNSGVLAQKVTPGIDVDYRKPNYEANGQPSRQVSLPAIKTQTKQNTVPAVTASAIQVQASQQNAESHAVAPVQTQEVMAASRTKSKAPAAPKKQPRLQTFRPGEKKTDKTESYSGTVNRIRWTDSNGVYNKIMAVIDTDDNADPQVYISGNSIHALFADCKNNADGLSSPYANLKTEIKRNAKGVELIFTPSGFTKAEKLVLTNPRRIAFDFFFPENVNITRAGSSSKLQASLPSRPAPAIPQVPANNTPRRRSQAVTTPPSTLTIPMTPGGSIRRKTVVIDPGHGGKDPGASDNGVTEKNVNLAVGLELEKALSSRGYKVVMTRNTDVYLTLQERTDIANRENADLFVSIHVNALPKKKSMTGFEIYIMALPTDKDAMNLAKIENREYVEGKGMDVANVDRRTEMLLRILGDMQQNNKISESTDFAAALYNAGAVNGLPMRRIAQAPFFVLRGAGMPAVLLEIGFVTNAAESRLLTTQNYQQKIANAMTAGIVNYLK